MATKLAIDDQPTEAARSIGEHETQSAVVTQAAAERIPNSQQLRIVGLFGSIDYDADYDYEAQRRRTPASAFRQPNSLHIQ